MTLFSLIYIVSSIFFSSPMSSPEDATPTSPEPPFTTPKVEAALAPYTRIYENVQGMLLWRRPLPMVLLLLVTELVFAFVYLSDLGFFSVLSIAVTFRYIAELIYHNFGSQISSALFPDKPKGRPDEPNRIRELRPFCRLFAGIANRAYSYAHRLFTDFSTDGLLHSTLVYLVLFVVFHLCGTFAVVFVLVHILLLAPGALLHPRAYPHTAPLVERIANLAEKAD